MSRCLLLLCMLCTWALSGAALGATDKACRKAYTKKRFQKAAACYAALFQQELRKGKKASKLRLDRYIRNQAFCWLKASQSATTLESKGYLKERAATLLQRSFQKGYCEAAERCRRNRVLVDKWRAEIGYTKLVVDGRDPKAEITLTGFQVSTKARHHLSARLRPGRYQLTIRQPAGQRLHKVLLLRANQPLTVQIRLSKIVVVVKNISVDKKLPPLILTGYLVGGLMLAGGTALLMVGAIGQGTLNTSMLDPAQNATLSDQAYNDGMALGQGLAVSGGIIGGLGTGLLLTALTAYLTRPKLVKPVPPTPKPPTKSQGTWLRRSLP